MMEEWLTYGDCLLQTLPLFIGVVLSVVILNRMRIYTSSGMFFSNPDDILETHKSGVVEIGGLSVFPIILISLCLTLGFGRWLGYYDVVQLNLGITGDRILQVMMGCALLYIVGLKTDIHGTFSETRAWALLVATAMFPLSGLWIRDFQGIFGIQAISPWLGIPLTMVISLYLTETVSLLDDVDGVGVGMVMVMLGIFLWIGLAYHFTLGVLMASAGLGICIPYTGYKFLNPLWKKTLMGRAGSYTLGYILSYASLSLVAPAGVEVPDGTLMIVLGITMVPMLDLLRTLRSRVREGRSVRVPDRNLMQHRLMRMGIPARWTPIGILLLIGLFATLNTVWVLMAYNLTLLVVVDVVLWGLMQIGIHYTIVRREERLNQTQWVVAYGRGAWEAERPVEKIRRKRERFGTMGLPEKYIMGDETAFIPDGMNAVSRQLKRLTDCLFSFILMVLFSPMFLICALLVKLGDGGPVFYRQERIGRFGRPFWIYKFRSMRIDAEKDGPALSHSCGEYDARLTRVGAFLRKHHLDELPQLWNIFCGDMSFIGYRPERQYYINQIMEHDPRYSMLYQIRPGVTSYATLYNGYTDTMEKMLRRLNYDLYYLEHRSFAFDIKILWTTFFAIIFGKRF